MWPSVFCVDNYSVCVESVQCLCGQKCSLCRKCTVFRWEMYSVCVAKTEVCVESVVSVWLNCRLCGKCTVFVWTKV